MLNRSKGAAVWVSRVIFRFGLVWAGYARGTARKLGMTSKLGNFCSGSRRWAQMTFRYAVQLFDLPSRVM